MATVPTLASTAAAVIDAETGDVVWSKAPDTQLRQASTTKTMTLLLLCEYNPALDDLITVSANAAGETGSSAGIAAGEVYTAHDLALGMMLPSGNDAATAIAEHVGQTYLGAGSAAAGLTAFVARMNARAVELGMDDTAYRNAHGMDDTGGPQHTTARDLARLGQVTFANAAAVAIAGTVAHAGVPVSGSTTARNWEHGNALLGAYQVVCGKGGNTPLAGRSLVVRYDVGGRRLIGVVLGAPSNNDRNDDTIAALEYARETLGLSGTLTGIATTITARVNDGFVATSYLPALYEHAFGMHSSTPGDSQLYRLWCTSFTVVAPTSNSRGIAELSIDGGPPIDVDFYSASAVKGATVFTVAGLADGPHTFELTVSGRKHPASSGTTVAFDEFHVTRVIGAGVTPSAVVYDLRIDTGSTYTNLPTQAAGDLSEYISTVALPDGDYVLEGRARDPSDDAATAWEPLPFTVAHAPVDPPPDPPPPGTYFAINGVPYPVLADRVRELPAEPAQGRVRRAFDGTAVATAAGELRRWSVPLAPMPPATHATMRSATARERRVTVAGLLFDVLAGGFAATVAVDDAAFRRVGTGHTRIPVVTVRQVDRG